jgi:DNA polymerase-4
MITQPPQDLRVLFLDMNAFFASVEQQVQPTLRERPILVTPHTGDTGCVISPSYEAKAQGVKTGMLVDRAKMLSPTAIVLESRPALYLFYHKEILKLINNFSPFVRVMSVDELAIKLTGEDQNQNRAWQMARQIKKEIRDKIGDWLTCSIGIGPNIFLAKMAAESKKPNGLVELKLKDLEKFYQSIKLTDIYGINSRLAARCALFGILTPSDFYKKNLQELARDWGIVGKGWYFRLRGYEIDDIEIPTRTIGHSYVLPPKLREPGSAKKVLTKLVGKAGWRLRKNKYWATSISLSISFLPEGNWHKSKKFPAFCDNQSFLRNSFILYDQCPIRARPFRLAVSASGLIKPNAEPIPIFPEIKKTNNLSKAIDKINDKYGASTIYPSSMAGAEDSAPDRIPFGSVRYEIRNE